MAKEKDEAPVITEAVDYKEFGLELSQAETVKKAFLPKQIEHEGYMEVYKNLLTMEISPEVCEQARELRLKLVKVRTGYNEIHKVEKAFYLNGGRFVDAIKNKKVLGVTQMEEQLQKLEDYYAEQERKRLDKLEEVRLSLLAEFPDFKKEIYDLRTMAGPDFNQLLQDQRDLKTMKEQREAREREEAEEGYRWKALNDQRREKTVKLANFINGWEDLPFADLTEEQYQDLMNEANTAYQEDQKAKAKLQAENDRLKAEQEAKDREEAEREKIRKEQMALQDKRLNEILKVNDAKSNKIDLSKLWELKDEDYNRILANKTSDYKKKEAERLEAEKKQKALEKELADKKAAEDLAIKKKAEEEAKRKEFEEAEARNQALAPDKEKMMKWVKGAMLPLRPDLNAEAYKLSLVISDQFDKFQAWAEKAINELK